jgi:hypothetical protein
MPSETPDRDVILAHLRRLPPGARGSSAANLAEEIRRRPPAQGGDPGATTPGVRRQLFALQAEGVVRGRVVQSGGPMCWVVTDAWRSPYNAAEVDALAGLVEQAMATAAALADEARQMGRKTDADRLAEEAATMHATAGQLRRLARTIT